MPLELSGIKVSLRQGESPTKEEIPLFKPEQINSGTIMAFVPSEAGQSFEVWVDNNLVSGEGLAYTTFIDGREMYRLAVRPHQNSSMKGVYDPTGVRPFTFSTLQLKEDDGEAPSFDISKLGVIEVHVSRAIITDNPMGVAYRTHNNVQARLDPVSEKAKKVGWHSVTLGAPKPAVKLWPTHTNYIDPLNKPYAIFRFRYKPRELLEDEGIAPPSERLKEPVAPVTGQKRPRPEEDANPGPSAKRAATQENVKPELTGTTSGSQAKTPKVEGAKKVESVKKEGAKKVKRERLDGEVIDLTNRGRSPIRVPIRGEVIDLSDD